jgi:hypothetical protein
MEAWWRTATARALEARRRTATSSALEVAAWFPKS